MVNTLFVPPGEIIHESLATSYVLVDALCGDLCEGGFSGVVAVVLRDTDSFIVISNGIVSAAIEKRDSQSNGGKSGGYAQTTVEEIAARSRRERGRLSIHAYPLSIANAVAGRINAQPLYVGLSTEFTDLEKMISKLLRERDREWFIDVNTESGPRALIHMRDNECRIIGESGVSDTGALDLGSNSALAHLIDECNRGNGTFDVYFTKPAAEAFQYFQPVHPDHLSPERISLIPPTDEPFEEHDQNFELTAEVSGDEAGAADEQPPYALPGESEPQVFEFVAAQPGIEDAAEIEASPSAMAAVASTHSISAPALETATPDLRADYIEPPAGELLLAQDDLAPAAEEEVEQMSEIKRLMGEIARTIEEAAQSVGRPDSFSMSLRAGQLRIADRFPFLDPFAGEFEYLAGEIVFVGRATADNFVEGLTAALKLAIDAVMQSTAYPDRFRSYVSEDLWKLHKRQQAELEKFGLEDVVQQLTTF